MNEEIDKNVWVLNQSSALGYAGYPFTILCESYKITRQGSLQLFKKSERFYNYKCIIHTLVETNTKIKKVV